MLSELVQYQVKAGMGFSTEFSKWYFSKYWQVRTKWVFAQTVTILNSYVLEVFSSVFAIKNV